jgi:hypothetical protein
MIQRGLRCLIIAALCSITVSAYADGVTVGLYAPTMPFTGTAARVETASKLADHFGAALGSNAVGRVYARASDFAAAVKKGEVTMALIDVAYLAHSGGNYTVVATVVRGGEIARPWQLVAKNATTLAQLQGKSLLVPSIGGRENDFVYAALFGGELPRNFFSKVDVAPDSISGLTALSLGKADAAVVPGGVELPSGFASVLSLTSAADAVVVVYGSDAQVRSKIAAAVASFTGSGVVGGLRTSDADVVKSLGRRFVVPVRRGPMAVPPAKFVVGELVVGAVQQIARPLLSTFVAHSDFSSLD